MGNKAAGGPFQLENGDLAPGFHVGVMNVSGEREEGCASAAVPPSNAAEAGSDGSGDDERAYASPVEAEEEGEDEAIVSVEERVGDSMNFTRNNSQSSMNNNRLPGSPAALLAAAAASTLAVGQPISGPVTAEGRPAEPVPPPAPPGVRASASASVSVSPPRAPGGNDLQLPPLNDPHPPPGSEEAARLGARGSPSSADGRDQKGAQ